MEIAQKTPDEIEYLKRDWRMDPCYDIEETEGFEAHRDELLSYSQQMKRQWQEDLEHKRAQEMESMGITNERTYNYLKRLERDIERLNQQVFKDQ